MPNVTLPVPVREGPHWRVLYRPATDRRIPSLSDCQTLVEKHQVRLRGWPFPHISHRPEQIVRGSTWLGSWSDFHIEYWRLYQSGQFLYLTSVREVSEPQWTQQLRDRVASLLGPNAEKAPGFFSFDNVIYTVTEYFEFAARLSRSGVYHESLRITIELKNIRGFVLSSEGPRFFHSLNQATTDDIANSWDLKLHNFVATPHEASLEALVWLFERLGWRNPSREIIRVEQEKFLARRA